MKKGKKKRKIMFQDFKNCLEADQIENTIKFNKPLRKKLI